MVLPKSDLFYRYSLFFKLPILKGSIISMTSRQQFFFQLREVEYCRNICFAFWGLLDSYAAFKVQVVAKEGYLILPCYLMYVPPKKFQINIFIQIALDTQYWTVWNHVTIWGSVVVYFGLTFAYNWIFQGQYIGSLTTAMQDQTFW